MDGIKKERTTRNLRNTSYLVYIYCNQLGKQASQHNTVKSIILNIRKELMTDNCETKQVKPLIIDNIKPLTISNINYSRSTPFMSKLGNYIM